MIPCFGAEHLGRVIVYDRILAYFFVYFNTFRFILYQPATSYAEPCERRRPSAALVSCTSYSTAYATSSSQTDEASSDLEGTSLEVLKAT